MRVGETYIVTFNGYTSEGLAVCRIDGEAVFVPYGIQNETAEIRIGYIGKNHAGGDLLRIIKPSSWRTEPKCRAFSHCGGCSFQHMQYAEELRLKKERVKDALVRIGKLNVDDFPIIGADSEWNYRNKSVFAVEQTDSGPIAGYYRAKTHQIMKIPTCALGSLAADQAKNIVIQWMRKYHVSGYIDGNPGEVRHIFIRNSSDLQQVQVCIMFQGTTAGETNVLIEMLKQGVLGITSIYFGFSDTRINTINCKSYKKAWGTETITDCICGVEYAISPASFFQINPQQTQKLYKTVMEYAQFADSDLVLDLYCGAGTITLLLAQKAKNVIGVETVPEAITNAKKNAKNNKIENVQFYCADAEKIAQEFAEKNIKPSLISVDPPRKGLSLGVVKAIIKMGAKHLIYVSCNPATLARDVTLFCANGYALQKTTAVDMFPKCAHVETVCLLVRRNGLHIDIDVDVEEMLQEKRGQATYPQIKEYVLEQTGMKVSSLYISQVKHKCGLEVGDSYNKPKSENSKVPQCPPEKEDAIKEALKHFGMI